MRHLRRGIKLNRSASHRHALFANLAQAIFDKERIITTLQKAKAMRSLVERLITYAKRKDLHSMRLAGRVILDKTILKKLFDEIGPSFATREGGYTRIIKLGERKGDNAMMAIIELVGRGGAETMARRKKKAKKAASGTQQQTAAAEAVPAAGQAETAEASEKETKAPEETAEPKKEKAAKLKAAKKPKESTEKESAEEKPKKKAAPKNKSKE
jgi:large subunit ribosomal protein L17